VANQAAVGDQAVSQAAREELLPLVDRRGVDLPEEDIVPSVNEAPRVPERPWIATALPGGG
jgi:hypothetical protein